jgi:glycosyltransferase involved in cell wall biosynthesis
MRPPVVSVVIDAYNYGRFVEEAIDSALAQDFPKEYVEILVVDDGSTDDTTGRVKKFGDSVKYFRKPNGGQASAINYGIAVSRRR